MTETTNRTDAQITRALAEAQGWRIVPADHEHEWHIITPSGEQKAHIMAPDLDTAWANVIAAYGIFPDWLHDKGAHRLESLLDAMRQKQST